jgi:hypothetical protein
MLRNTSTYDGQPTPASPAEPPSPLIRTIDGRKLARRLHKGLSPTHAALLAHELETGTCRLHRLSRRQACSFTGASWGYVATLARASEEEIERVEKGTLALSELHNTRKSDPFKALANAMNEVEAELDDDESITVGEFIDRVFAKLGDGVLAAAFDRLTAPASATNDIAMADRAMNAPDTQPSLFEAAE